MADVTGGVPPTGGSPFDIPGDLGKLYKHFGDTSMFSVANAAALPAADNWPGRRLMTRDNGSSYEWSGTVWVMVLSRSDKAVVYAAGWQTQTMALTTRERARHVVLSGRIARASGSSVIVGTVDALHSPGHEVPFRVGSVGGGNVPGPEFFGAINPAGQITLTLLSGAWAASNFISLNVSWTL